MPHEVPIVIKQGTFLYGGQVVWYVRIHKRDLLPGTGDLDDPPELRDDLQGPFYCVVFDPDPESKAYRPWHDRCFESLSEAMQHVDEVLRPSGGVRWVD